MPYISEDREKALFGGSEERQRRRALGLKAAAIHQRRVKWLTGFEQTIDHDWILRRRSLALAHACWFRTLTDCYLEDIGKPLIQNEAIYVLGLCESAEHDNQHFGWVSRAETTRAQHEPTEDPNHFCTTATDGSSLDRSITIRETTSS